MDEREDKIRQRAHRLWEEEGRPDGRAEHHWQQAKEMIGIEEGLSLTTHKVAEEPVAEPIEALTNAGEFPTLTDQGEMQIPHHAGTGDDIPPPHREEDAGTGSGSKGGAKSSGKAGKPKAPAKSAAKIATSDEPSVAKAPKAARAAKPKAEAAAAPAAKTPTRSKKS